MKDNYIPTLALPWKPTVSLLSVFYQI